MQLIYSAVSWMLLMGWNRSLRHSDGILWNLSKGENNIKRLQICEGWQRSTMTITVAAFEKIPSWAFLLPFFYETMCTYVKHMYTCVLLVWRLTELEILNTEEFWCRLNCLAAQVGRTLEGTKDQNTKLELRLNGV